MSTTPNNKPASAPSEQDLKEEEEFQLALALSLSETPAKFSFPDIKQFEDKEDSEYNNQKSAINSYLDTVENSVNQEDIAATTTPINVQTQQLSESNNVKTSHEIELRQLIDEAKSTAEVIINRVNSNRLRNRSNDHDSALQNLFLKLTTMRDKLLDHSKNYELERASYERIQDKLSEISDARAALDSLREEYQEKKRKDAEEAERQRQSQLAIKLGMMREKKSQMMQYHRELALQRIQAQEMMMNQPQSSAGPISITNSQWSQQWNQPQQPQPQPQQPQPQQLQLQQPQPQQPQSQPQQPLPQQSLSQQPLPPQAQTLPPQSQQQQCQPWDQHQQHWNQQPQWNQQTQEMINQVQPNSGSIAIINNEWVQQQQRLMSQPRTLQTSIPQTVLTKSEDEAPLISFDD